MTGELCKCGVEGMIPGWEPNILKKIKKIGFWGRVFPISVVVIKKLIIVKEDKNLF